LRGFVDGLVFGSPNLPLGLEPVVELRAWSLASFEVEFVGSPPDSFP
jgi:hypothetical protein